MTRRGASAVRFCLATLVALAVVSCADDTESSSPARSTSGAGMPTEVDLVALIEGIPGYTYAPAPEVEQAFASEVREAAPVVRAVLLSGQPQGNVIILTKKDPLSEQDVRNTLAGAESGGNKQGTATRSEIGGRPAVKTVRQDGATTWSTTKGRYTVIVGARPEVADDLTRQVLERLPE